MIDRISTKKRNLIIALIVVIATIQFTAMCSALLFNLLMQFNVTDKPEIIYIDRYTTGESLKNNITSKLNERTAIYINLLLRMTGSEPWKHPGCYRVTPDMNGYDLFWLISGRENTTVKLTFNNIRTKDEFAKTVSKYLVLPEDTIMGMMNDSTLCRKLGFNKETITSMFLPDSYEIYHNCAPEAFMRKMKIEYDRFWNEKRKKLAADAGLSPVDVSILASIVEEETKRQDEMSRVAGLYINRLRGGIPLQADPTVKFAIGDFSLHRILKGHLDTESPYNTYKYSGLPPGPIRISSKAAIDAVLNYENNNYIYMCAKEDLSGSHNFTKSYAEHQRNAAKYRNALNALNIK
ncbi:MAG: endolytic transglycosylase MltG [Bacteroidales bacterium]